MDFGLTDDQRQIQSHRPRAALRALAASSASARTPRSVASTRGCGASCASLAGRVSRSQSATAVRGSVAWSSRSSARSWEARSRQCRSYRRVLAATLIEHAGSEEQRERWLPGLASGETIGAVGVLRDGVAEMVRRSAHRGGCWCSSTEDSRVRAYARPLHDGVTVEEVDSIDPTRPAGRVSAPEGAGEELPGDVARAWIARWWRSPQSL